MQKSAKQKKATSAHRKVKTAGVKSRKATKRTTPSGAKVVTVKEAERIVAPASQSRKKSQDSDSAKSTHSKVASFATPAKSALSIKVSDAKTSDRQTNDAKSSDMESANAKAVSTKSASAKSLTKSTEVKPNASPIDASQKRNSGQNQKQTPVRDSKTAKASASVSDFPVSVKIKHFADTTPVASAPRASTPVAETQATQATSPAPVISSPRAQSASVKSPAPARRAIHTAEPASRSTQAKTSARAKAPTPPLDEVVESVVYMPRADVARVNAKMRARAPQPAPASRPTAKQLKDDAIRQAISTASKSPARPAKKRTHIVFGWKRVMLALCSAAAIVFSIVYFVNISSPNISIKVAAMQSGIDATSPSYIPRDYNLSDITSEKGKITLRFRNSATDSYFTITEEECSWDSSALETNYIREEYGEDYTVVAEQGLKLYIANNGAAWVNGKIVYKLKVGSGTLTKKQIRAIATSL